MSMLRKIGRILLLVGGIFALLDIFVFLLCGIALCITPFILFQNQVVDLGDQTEMIINIAGIAVGVLFIFSAIFCLVEGILGIKGFKEHRKGLYIANIIFAVLAGFNLLPLVGSILGLIALKKEKKLAAPEEPAPEAAAE